MLKRLILAEDPIAPDTWETVEVESVCEFLASRFANFPDTARIYHGQVSEETDITPHNENEIDHLENLEGTFYVVIYAADPVSIVVAVVFAVIAAVALAQTIPDIPEPMSRKQDNSSPNNELSERKNRVRINGRIPDIFGTVRAIPDLIAPNYTVYENNLEVEHSLMCIGKGSFEIPENEVREGTTLYSQIENSVIEVYGSGVPPRPYSPKQLQIGPPITEAFVATDRNKAVNGQTLIPSISPTISGDNDILFAVGWRELGSHSYYIENDGSYNFRDFITSGSNIEVTNGVFNIDVLDLTQPVIPDTNFIPGFSSVLGFLFNSDVYPTSTPDASIVQITNSNFEFQGQTFDLDGVYYTLTLGTGGVSYMGLEPSNVNPNWEIFRTNSIGAISADFRYLTISDSVNIDGVFQVSDVSEERIYLSNPQLVSSDWDKVLLQDSVHLSTFDKSPTLENIRGSFIGPFIIDDPDTSEIIVNFLAPQGLHTDDGTNQTALTCEIETAIQRVDAGGNPVGVEEVHNAFLVGSTINKGRRYITGRFALSEFSRCTVKCSRITPYVTGFTGQVSEEVKWVGLYGAKSISNLAFGDVTIVRSKGVAAVGTTAPASRELNMLVTRKIPQRISGDDFTTGLFPTNRADDIISFISMDPRIGNRSKGEVDFDSIYNTVAQIEAYFGSSIATEFNYTFDSDNLSFEEMASSIAKAIFCTAYRRGNLIKLSFEGATENSTLLFNHRNKLPGGEIRTVRFGNQKGNDGVEFDYVDPSDGSIQTLYLPDQNAINPQRVDTPGIRNKLQAYFHAHRLWNKIRYQHIATEFEATQEADLLVLGDRILNADNTRPNIQDGEVEAQLGLELVLSQKVDLTIEPNYIIFIQSPDGTIESMGITTGSDEYRVVLANAPAVALSLDANNFARTTYLIVGSTESNLSAFLVTEKQPNANFTSTVTAINYDSRYYDNDKDVENSIVDENGNII